MYRFLNHSKDRQITQSEKRDNRLAFDEKGQFQETSSFYDEDDNDVYSFSSSSSLLIGLFLALRSQ